MNTKVIGRQEQIEFCHPIICHELCQRCDTPSVTK
jgi:hypothetical protein